MADTLDYFKAMKGWLEENSKELVEQGVEVKLSLLIPAENIDTEEKA